MAYTDRPGNTIAETGIATSVVEYHDRVRWGPIFAGIVIALATQLVLSALGAAIGFGAVAPGTNAGDVGIGVGIWAIISLLISLFVGSWVMARTCGPMNNKTAMLNGAILWGTTLALSAWLLASGVAGAFGILAPEVIDQVQQQGGTTGGQIDQAQAQRIADNTSKAAWSFLFGSLLGLVASLIGASVGARKPRMRA